jgi:hypothetical protein
VQTRPSQAVLKIRISGALLDSFLEMASAKMMNPEDCAAQCVETEIAAFRALKIRPSLVASFLKDKSVLFVTKKKPRRYVQLTESQIAEAARLVRDEGFTIVAVAKRFQKSSNRMGLELRKRGFIAQRQA